METILQTDPCNIQIGETRYLFYKLKRKPEVQNQIVIKSPELCSSLALEKLILEGQQSLEMEQNLSLVVSTVSSVYFL